MNEAGHAKLIRACLTDLCKLLDTAHMDGYAVRFKLNSITGDHFAYRIEKLELIKDYTYKD